MCANYPRSSRAAGRPPLTLLGRRNTRTADQSSRSLKARPRLRVNLANAKSNAAAKRNVGILPEKSNLKDHGPDVDGPRQRDHGPDVDGPRQRDHDGNHQGVEPRDETNNSCFQNSFTFGQTNPCDMRSNIAEISRVVEFSPLLLVETVLKSVRRRTKAILP